MNVGRRGFLKCLGIFTGGAAATVAGAAINVPDIKEEKIENYIKRTYKKDGINFVEYEIPQTVQALFKRPGRDRAVYCPIRNINKEKIDYYKPAEIKDFVDSMVKAIEYHRSSDNGKKYERKGKYKLDGEWIEGGKWQNPYLYIVRIKGRPELFGVMISHEQLDFETDAYTIY